MSGILQVRGIPWPLKSCAVLQCPVIDLVADSTTSRRGLTIDKTLIFQLLDGPAPRSVVAPSMWDLS
jgi:hypothetical protein